MRNILSGALLALLLFAPLLYAHSPRKNIGGMYQHHTTLNTPVYKQATGTISEGYLGHPATLYARRMNATGVITLWIRYTSDSHTHQANGPEATRLINLYKHKALSHL